MVGKAETEANYFAEHPEKWERLEKQFEESINELPEDRVLKDLYFCICGFSAYGIDELLAKLDAKSEKAIAFLKTEEVQTSLKEKRKLRKAIIDNLVRTV